MRVLKQCIADVVQRGRAAQGPQPDAEKKDKNKPQQQEEDEVDPVKMAAMLVQDSKLFQRPKKQERVDGELDGAFQWKFDLREEWHLRQQMQALSNISPGDAGGGGGGGDDAMDQTPEEKKASSKKKAEEPDQMIEREKRENCRKYFTYTQLKLA